MEITNEEAKQLNKERIDATNRARADAFAARKAANTQYALYKFSLRHSGQSGLKWGDYWPCEANSQILLGWIEQQDNPEVTEQSLENAFVANRGKLATRPTLNQPYQRQTDTGRSRVFPQLKELQQPQPPAYIGWTKAEILSWSPDRLAKEMKKNLDGINKILAGQN